MRIVSVLLLIVLAACQGERALQVPAEVRAAEVQQMAEMASTPGKLNRPWACLNRLT
jgi:hypothetical protein